MSVDLTDPNVTRAYDDIIKNKGTDWLLVTYGGTRDKLSLLSSGQGNFDDLCRNVPREPEDVFFGFCRERDGGNNYYALIAFVPEGVSGVRRAKALVHSRAVGAVFKAANISMNVQNIVTQSRDKLRERLQISPSYIPRLASNSGKTIPRSASTPISKRSASESAAYYKSTDHSLASYMHTQESQARRSASPTYANIPSIPSEYDEIEGPPPPTPPKETYYTKSASAFVKSVSTGSMYETIRPRYDSFMSDGDEVVISPGKIPVRAMHHSHMLTPEARAQKRLEVQKRKEAEELQAVKEEEERQIKLKREKEEMLRQAEEEERRRLVKLEEEKRRALAERARREMEAKLEEERRAQEMELRRQKERERRRRETEELEAKMKEMELRAAEAAKRKAEQRRMTEASKKQRMKTIQDKYARANGVLLAGSVTVQTSMSISWKRRYFELSRNALAFYRDSQERASPLDVMILERGRVAAIKEPDEGYDQLEAIPHSFAVEFTDGDGAWCMYCDNAEDKDVLMSLLSQAAGL